MILKFDSFEDNFKKMETEIEELTQKNVIFNENFTATITELSNNLWVYFIYLILVF